MGEEALSAAAAHVQGWVEWPGGLKRPPRSFHLLAGVGNERKGRIKVTEVWS